MVVVDCLLGVVADSEVRSGSGDLLWIGCGSGLGLLWAGSGPFSFELYFHIWAVLVH